jgi:hypothetical protein
MLCMSVVPARNLPVGNPLHQMPDLSGEAIGAHKTVITEPAVTEHDASVAADYCRMICPLTRRFPAEQSGCNLCSSGPVLYPWARTTGVRQKPANYGS